ncbi:hypothetical protein MHYP_G00355950 [Metynnis hypsauchen]
MLKTRPPERDLFRMCNMQLQPLSMVNHRAQGKLAQPEDGAGPVRPDNGLGNDRFDPQADLRAKDILIVNESQSATLLLIQAEVGTVCVMDKSQREKQRGEEECDHSTSSVTPFHYKPPTECDLCHYTLKQMVRVGSFCTETSGIRDRDRVLN